jgi:hypothetical protein
LVGGLLADRRGVRRVEPVVQLVVRARAERLLVVEGELELAEVQVVDVVGVRQVMRVELDADRGEVLLDHLHGGHPVGVVADVVHGEGQPLPGRVRHDPAGHVVAGLRQQGLRLGRVVAVAPADSADWFSEEEKVGVTMPVWFAGGS